MHVPSLRKIYIYIYIFYTIYKYDEGWVRIYASRCLTCFLPAGTEIENQALLFHDAHCC